MHLAYVGHDFPYQLPIKDGLSQVLLTVEETRQYPLLGWESDEAWLSLGSSSSGYVRLGPSNRLFTVTMFHEMHCLRMLNLAFDPSIILAEGHFTHCLGYLRQQILCQPDLTLEPASWESRDFESDREGATHVCWDWEKVYETMEENWQMWKHTRQALDCDEYGTCIS